MYTKFCEFMGQVRSSIFFSFLEIWVGGSICDFGRFADLLGWVYADLCCGFGPI